MRNLRSTGIFNIKNCVISAFALVLAFILMLAALSVRSNLFNIVHIQYQSECTQCPSKVACSYKDEVDLRVIVLTYNRVESLKKCLTALQNADIMGVEAVLEIWIDISKDGQVDYRVLQFAESFRWQHGRTCVHIQNEHVSVAFQWIYSWRPRHGTKEIGVIIEDDIDVSKFFFRFLKSAREFYSDRIDISGICLNDRHVLIVNGPQTCKQLPRPTERTDIVFLYGLFCTWGFAPDPDHWRGFQDWYQKGSLNKSNKPCLKGIELHQKWYDYNSKYHMLDSFLHEAYFMQYSVNKNLTMVWPNLQTVHSWRNTSLSLHRAERGLHFDGKRKFDSQNLNVWREEFVNFPKFPKKFTLNGSLI